MRKKQHALGQPSDIAFLLIIFFLLMIGINGTGSMEISTSGEAIHSEQKPLVLTIQADGKLFIGTEPISLENLAGSLARYASLHAHIAESSRWQDIVDVLSIAGTLGIPVAMEVLR